MVTPEDAITRARALLDYAYSLPDDDEWLPGELEEHRRRAQEEPGYLDQPCYIRPQQFLVQEHSGNKDTSQ